MKKNILLIILFFAISLESFANNLIMGTPTVSGSTVTFTIKWDNSWNVTTGPSNWDAVWIFVKRQTCVSGTTSPWVHADLANSGHSVTGSQLQVDTVLDNKGVFIRMKTAGIGNIDQATVTLTLSSVIGSDNIGVYGMEMVNIPQGQFYIGDGRTDLRCFTDGNSTNPKLIDATVQSNGLGVAANYQKEGLGSWNSLPGTFPLGYNRFYCMKYEISAAQYVAFLNTLSYKQQLRMQRDYNSNTTPPTSAAGTQFHCWPCSGRSANIVIATPAQSVTQLSPAVYANDYDNDGVYNEDEDGLGIPVVMNMKNFFAFLDWAAIRPMTEFEYEKVCRGPNVPVMNEYAWGSTDINNQLNIANRGKSTENNSNNYLGPTNCGTDQLFRSGIFATATSDRIHAGSSYYGVLDMTGGVWESCIGGWNVDFSTFTTANGDGNLYESGDSTNNGSTDMSEWVPNKITAKGGGANWQDVWQDVSARQWVNFDGYNYYQGGRGVRSY